MLWKNRKYKGLDFSDATQRTLQRELWYSFPLQEKSDSLASRTDEWTHSNYHWGQLSRSLYGVRYLNFAGVGIGKSKEERAKVLRLLQEKLSLTHGIGNLEYFDLYRETDDGQARTCKAKISQALETKHQLNSYKFDYTFQLACPSEKIYGIETKVATLARGFLWGAGLEMGLEDAIGSFAGGGIVINEGNRYAPLKIQIIGKCTNPKLYNATTGEVIRLVLQSQNLIFDNRNLNFKEGKNWILEDGGENVSSKRATGKDLYLAPGENHIVVITDDPEENPEVIITRRDTFNY